jgi:ATP-dependent 26S proteasome regulatory subunit
MMICCDTDSRACGSISVANDTQRSISEIGYSCPKGVLLYGPPGIGKTLMARVCAAQTNATVLKLADPQLVPIGN